MLKATNEILECLKEGEKVKNMEGLCAIMAAIEPLQMGINSFIENKLIPVHEAIERGEDPFAKNENPEEIKNDFDWNEYLKNLKSDKSDKSD